MASVDIKKYTRQQTHGLAVHYEDRLRSKLHHSNPDIDRSRVGENEWKGCTGYRDVLRNLEQRVKAADAELPPLRTRSDRVTAIFLNVPCPKELEQQGKAPEFFAAAFETLQNFLGKDNVAGAVVHKDETHTYLDHGEMKESLQHMDVFAVPWTPEKGVNAKARCTKEFFRDVSEVVHQMCLERFGVEYKTGEYARKKSVEQLKAESYRELLQTVERLSGDVGKLQQQLDFTESQLKEQQLTGKRVLSSLNAEISTKERNLEETLDKLENAKNQSQEVEKRLRNVAAQIESGKIGDLELKNILYCLEMFQDDEKSMEPIKQLHDLGKEMLAADLTLQAEVLQQVFDKLKEETPVIGEHREKI